MQPQSIAAATLILSILLMSSYAQNSSDHFQSVGGDFGKAWLKDRATQTQKSTGNNSGGLWSFGSPPKGKIIVDGKLVNDPYYIWKSLNYTYGWLGEVYVDPSTGYPVYSYIDPYTGLQIYFYQDPNAKKTVYFYVDPATGRPVYINGGTANGIPGYGSFPSPYGYGYSPAPSWIWPFAIVFIIVIL
jgi:hypothetical protein